MATEQEVTPAQNLVSLTKQLAKIFMPHAAAQTEKAFNSIPSQTHAKFVHYTSAESALNIIKSKRIWMRNTNCMGDYREVQHGYDIFFKYFDGGKKEKALTEALSECAPGAAQDALAQFNQAWNDIRYNTYITAISEHDETENQNGRLSMWRAFGRTGARVGIVLNLPWFAADPQALSIVFSPVAYLSENAAHSVLDETIENIRGHRDLLSTVDRSVIVRTIFMMFLAGVVCLKHEGFREEREWRAIYAPRCWASPLLKFKTVVVEGVPQVVYEIPLDKTVSASISDLDFAVLFDRIIIGPTQFAWPMAQAFIGALTDAGVSDAVNRIVASEIPIRT